MTNYCTASDLIDFGVPGAVDDDNLIAACDLASRVVENYCGKLFTPFTGAATISDVHGSVVVPPRPFSNVTAIAINAIGGSSGYAVASTGWTIDYDTFRQPLSILLYVPGVLDADGFLQRAQSTMPYPGYYGNVVTVTATYGYVTTPSPVVQATKRLAARYAVSTVRDLGPDLYISQIDVEGYRISQNKLLAPLIDTTNDPTADALLAPYRSAATSVSVI